MKISIITVCYNAEKLIRETIESVLGQTYQNVEYIIVDGASIDGTLSIVDEYRERVEGDKQGEMWNMIVISEPDQGIYDAMNKGVEMASGDYIQFLNAGDCFVDAYVVERVIEKMKGDGRNNRNVFYGNIRYRYSDGTKELRKYGPMCGRRAYFMSGDCLNHQAIFASRECFKLAKFNTEYRICADREWMMRLMNAGVIFVGTGILMCEYLLDEDSASVRNSDIYRAEARKCMKQLEPAGYPIFLLFGFMRNNKVLQKILHQVYRTIYIRK